MKPVNFFTPNVHIFNYNTLEAYRMNETVEFIQCIIGEPVGSTSALDFLASISVRNYMYPKGTFLSVKSMSDLPGAALSA